LVAETGVVKEAGYLYFVEGNELWRSRMKRPGERTPIPKERVWSGQFVREPGYMYYVGPRGEIRRTPLTLRQPLSAPSPATEVERRKAFVECLSLPISDAEYLRIEMRIPLALQPLLPLSIAELQLRLRGAWSRLTDEDVRTFAACMLDGQPKRLWVGENATGAWIEIATPDEGSFFLAPPIDRSEILAALQTADVRPEMGLVEFFESFGALRDIPPQMAGDFVLPSRRLTFSNEFARNLDVWADGESYRDAPIVYRASNGDRVLIDGRTGGFLWANHETCKFRPAGSSFGDVLRRYLRTRIEGRVFDAFSG
jgi:hypothetical protein